MIRLIRGITIQHFLKGIIVAPLLYVLRGCWSAVKILLTPFSFLLEPLFQVLNLWVRAFSFFLRPATPSIVITVLIYISLLSTWWDYYGQYGDGENSYFFNADMYLFNIFYYYLVPLKVFFLVEKLTFCILPFFYYMYVSFNTAVFDVSSYLCPVDLGDYLEYYLFLEYKYKVFFAVEWFNAYVPYNIPITTNDMVDILLKFEYTKFISDLCPIHWENPFANFFYIFNNLFYYIKFDYVFICFINLLIALPIICFMLILSIGLYGSMYVITFFNFLFWVIVFSKFEYFFFNEGLIKVSCFKWFNFFGYKLVYFELHIDCLSYSYILLTLSIAVFVFVYTFAYFKYEPNVERLIFLINSFVASMIILVAGGNMFVLYLGWELIGITSFFLINFWSTKISTLKAAFKAFAFNKLSDVALLFSICIIFYLSMDGNISFLAINSVINNEKYVFFDKIFFLNDLLCFLLLISAFIKSAQIGFHIWLPDSMEAPVPASALIHSATLVSAGVYLVLRFSNIIDFTLYMSLVFVFGLITAFVGGSSASYQSDAKKTLAYSTISHCGFLMVGCFFKTFELSIFYLYVHGFFKALIFMCLGNVLRVATNQDTRLMGTFWKVTPYEFYVSCICLFNLSGSPFTLGFFMKHFFILTIVENFFKKIFSIIFVLLAALAGLIYCYRLIYAIYFDFKKADEIIYLPMNRVENWIEFNATVPQGSIHAISTLLFIGIFICFLFFLFFFTNFFLNELLDNSFFSKNQYLNYNLINIEKNLLISYINYIILFMILVIISISWRFSTSVKTLFFYNYIELFVINFVFLLV